MKDAGLTHAQVLSAERLSIGVGTRTLIDGLDLVVRSGEVWAVLGPNGCGKSTLLHVLAGLAPARSGVVRWLGRAVADWPPLDAARLRSLLPQRQADAFSASVEETVLLGRHPYIGRFGWESQADRTAARDAMKIMDIEHLATRDVLTLSGGERQRVALASLFAQDTSLVLLDEPTAHLDLDHQARLFRHLAALAHEHARAIVFATHEFNLAARFATHALLIDASGRVRMGTAKEVLVAAELTRLLGFPVTEIAGGMTPIFVPQW